VAIDITKFVIRFVEEARDHINRLNQGLGELEAGNADREIINAIFRSAHTIKGSSRMLKLVSISQTAHKLEDVLGALRDGSLQFTATLGQLLYRAVDTISELVDTLALTSDGANLPPPNESLCADLAAAANTSTEPIVVAAPAVPVASPVAPADERAVVEPKFKVAETVRVRLNKLDELIKLMGEVVSSHATLRQRLADIQEIERESGKTGQIAHLYSFVQSLKDDVLQQEVLMDELHDKTLQMRMLPLTVVFEPAARMVRDLARSVGKQVECIVRGAEIELDRQMIDKLSDPIIHLIRNCVDHGLEIPEQRIGKPAQGKLTLSARQDGSWVVIEIADDGSGIPLDVLRENAIKKGFISSEKAAALTEREVIDLIFLPGFSTNTIITDLSGRGVGMDVVKQCILDDLQGAIGIETRAGQGTTFSLRLPLSLAVMRVLLVEVNGLPFAFTAQNVSELLQLSNEMKLTVAERNAVIIRNEFVSVVSLAGLLGIAVDSSRVPRHDMLLVVLRIRNAKIAVLVDELIDERDMVIKQLPEHMRKLPIVSGIVTTGKNELVSVLHAPALLDLARNKQLGRTESIAPAVERHYKILVVDDSLNTREIEKDVLEAHGYHITLAEDGVDGLQKALDDDFDAILTDVEMPNMDGFTLTARLRQVEKYQKAPIVIITSREKEEDKRRGIQVGADAYIVKGDFDQNNLVNTLRALLG
jgi:two-component system chemotaxis sensor kinase CheA